MSIGKMTAIYSLKCVNNDLFLEFLNDDVLTLHQSIMCVFCALLKYDVSLTVLFFSVKFNT